MCCLAIASSEQLVPLVRGLTACDSPLLMQTSLCDLNPMLTNRLLAKKLFPHFLYILWHVDPLLGNDGEIKDYTTAVTR
jgi:hypothetical protein